MFEAVKRFFKRSSPGPGAALKGVVVGSERDRGKSKTGQAQNAASQQTDGKSPPSADEVQVSLPGIILLLPENLQPLANLEQATGAALVFPRKPVLDQLSTGSVKFPLSQIASAAPASVFTAEARTNETPIALPLGELLAQIAAKSLPRRPNQRQVKVPADIGALFGPKGEPAPADATTKKLASSQAPASPEKPASTGSSKPPVKLTEQTAAQAPERGTSPKTDAASGEPRSPGAPSPLGPQVVSVNASLKEQLAAFSATSAANTPPVPVAAPLKPLSSTLAALGTRPLPKPSATQAKPLPGSAHSTASAAAPASDTETVKVPLAALANLWPQEIKKQITELKFGSVSVEFPVNRVMTGLRSGSVRFKWGEILGWVRTDSASPEPTSLGECELDLPLNVLAPFFIAKRGEPLAAKPSVIGEGIPDLFSVGSVPTPPPQLPPQPSAKSEPSAVLEPQAVPVAVAVPPVSDTDIMRMGDLSAKQTPSSVMLPFNLVAESWPEALRKEVAKVCTPDLRVELPFAETSAALKQGKVEYSWAQLREWMRPTLPPGTGEEYLTTMILLPLKILAPIFMAQARGQRPPVVPGAASRSSGTPSSEEIPDLFNASRASGGTTTFVAAPKESRGEPGTSPKAFQATPQTTFQTSRFKKVAADLSELFGQPGKKNWTPNELVAKTCKLEHMLGSIIALQDGLLVASQLPSHWKADIIAAFLPQVFSRMQHYARELQIGDLKQVSLVLDSGTFLVFATGTIFFAVLVRSGEPIPHANLNLIVAELARHSK